MKGQERNTAQLERIGAVVEQRWGLKKESKEEDENNEEGSKDGSIKSQKKETLSFVFC